MANKAIVQDPCSDIQCSKPRISRTDLFGIVKTLSNCEQHQCASFESAVSRRGTGGAYAGSFGPCSKVAVWTRANTLQATTKNASERHCALHALLAGAPTSDVNLPATINEKQRAQLNAYYDVGSFKNSIATLVEQLNQARAQNERLQKRINELEERLARRQPEKQPQRQPQVQPQKQTERIQDGLFYGTWTPRMSIGIKDDSLEREIGSPGLLVKCVVTGQKLTVEFMYDWVDPFGNEAEGVVSGFEARVNPSGEFDGTGRDAWGQARWSIRGMVTQNGVSGRIHFESDTPTIEASGPFKTKRE